MLQDIEKHREVALEYLKYFDSTLLPSETLDIPKGTRIERVEVYCLHSFHQYGLASSAVWQIWHVSSKPSCNCLPESYASPTSSYANIAMVLLLASLLLCS